MRIIRSIRSMRKFAQTLKTKGQSIGFVPTMGALHEGHLSLIRQARRDCKRVVVSIFVNPAQFGPKEDFKRYPRNLGKDVRLCRKAGVDVIFYPQVKEIYPENYKTWINVEGLDKILCGKFRPGHFRGVATIVAKLFNAVQPEIAYFGQKDAQQAVIIQKMAADLNLPVKIKVMPTVRASDGLALSSRNSYLDRQERSDALALPQALELSKDLLQAGIKDTSVIKRQMQRLIKTRKHIKLEYIALVDAENLQPLKKLSGRCLVALAARVGKTRLVDNTVLRCKN